MATFTSPTPSQVSGTRNLGGELGSCAIRLRLVLNNGRQVTFYSGGWSIRTATSKFGSRDTIAHVTTGLAISCGQMVS